MLFKKSNSIIEPSETTDFLIMDTLNEIINYMLPNHCVYRDGFVFTCVYKPANIYNGIVIRNPEKCDCWTPKKNFSTRTLAEHIDLINKYKIEKAFIIANDISFIKKCPTLKYIEIVPADTTSDNFDYSPLYDMPNICYLNCRTKYGGSDELLSTTIDYSKINGIRHLHVEGHGHLNYNNQSTLQSVTIIGEKTNKDLKYIYNCKNLIDLELTQCSLTSLDGIDSLNNLQQLSLYYNRNLQDITMLRCIASSLRSLTIENCPRIVDFSCLHQLVNLEHLHLFGKNVLPNLNFLKCMKKLKTFSFSMYVSDGNLSECLHIPYVNSEYNRKTYNLKNSELPKQTQIEPFEFI